jgi:hypothetical protein
MAKRQTTAAVKKSAPKTYSRAIEVGDRVVNLKLGIQLTVPEEMDLDGVLAAAKLLISEGFLRARVMPTITALRFGGHVLTVVGTVGAKYQFIPDPLLTKKQASLDVR